MKIEIIKQNIINNYKQLSNMSKVSSHNKSEIPVWGLNYKRNGVSGFIGETGNISRNHSNIKVSKDSIHLIKKPIFSTWKRALSKINDMLEDTKSNINNKNIVNKKVVTFLCFPKDTLPKLTSKRV